ncbi:hypothetical protein [Zavarzinella formosa]|uniref:hypothetical protein n=1 Tax=Zavarzinella formosa TaxID=360055 RepID=UPI0002D6ED19|nr:hypothetical protein [Zavarzinella formosa]
MGWFFLFLIVPLFLLIAIVCGIFALFLGSIGDLLKTIRPEHRRMAPGLVWYCLIPGAGAVMAVWMVHQVAASLRRQFTALGKPEPTNTYSLVTGQIWTGGAVLAIVSCVVGYQMGDFDIAGPVVSMLFIAAFLGWITYWVRMTRYKNRLRQYLPVDYLSRLSPEELDYGDDLPHQAGH